MRVASRALTPLALAAAVSAAAGAACASTMNGPGPVNAKDNDAVVVLMRDGATCKPTVHPDPVPGWKQKKVRWHVMNLCEADARVVLDFREQAACEDIAVTATPFNGHWQNMGQCKVKNAAQVKPYKYDVEVTVGGTTYTLDPELDVRG